MDDRHCAYCGRTHPTASCPLAWGNDCYRPVSPCNVTGRITAVLCLLAMMTACTDEPATYRALKGAGYSDVHITGYSAFGCADSDDFATGFTARGPTGQTVSGVVCSGVLKGATIRTD